ncbi:hypothetical protein TSOC111612_14145 [Tsukamurella ocularis]
MEDAGTDLGVRGEGGDVAGTVVEGEQESPRERGETGPRHEGPVERRGGLAKLTGERGGDDVAHALVRRRRQQARGGEALPDRVEVADTAQLEVAPRRQLQRLTVGELRENVQLGRFDGAAGQPHPHQGTVGRRVRSQDTRAGVGLLRLQCDQSSKWTGGRVMTWPA